MDTPKRILLYGFGPYREFHDNITSRILRSLAPMAGVKKVVFPVRFHRRQFVDSITLFKPEMILGLGQSSRRGIDVEGQAVNRRRGSARAPSRMIARNGPKKITTTLKLKTGRQAGRSADAGDYVCNFSMYVMLDHIQRNGIDVPYGFIHIPHDYDTKKATALVEKILRQFGRSSLAKAVHPRWASNQIV